MKGERGYRVALSYSFTASITELTHEAQTVLTFLKRWARHLLRALSVTHRTGTSSCITWNLRKIQGGESSIVFSRYGDM